MYHRRVEDEWLAQHKGLVFNFEWLWSILVVKRYVL